ncbi:MAG: alpha/beta hydrolase [Promethearchaeota archaeon]|nr:MAG: alpha/beta hydrolase [Candidatus Lokiarchaeota archaeon]
MTLFDEIEETFIKINDIKLHAIIIGSGEPLILLHGFPEFWYCWKDIIPGLKHGFKMIIPDMRGYNLSDKPKGVENYTLDLLVEDIKGLCEALELDKFYLAGHDWGGVVAWGFAEKYPELLKKLIILNAPHPIIFRNLLMKNKDKAQRKASGYIFKFLQPGGETFLFEKDFQALKLAVFGMARNKEAFNDFDKQKYVEAWSQPGAITAAVNYYRASVGERAKMDEWTGIIKVPTLVIHGMKDMALTPKILVGLEEFVEDLTIMKSENSSHWILVDDPKLVISSILDFIS